MFKDLKKSTVGKILRVLNTLKSGENYLHLFENVSKICFFPYCSGIRKIFYCVGPRATVWPCMLSDLGKLRMRHSHYFKMEEFFLSDGSSLKMLKSKGQWSECVRGKCFTYAFGNWASQESLAKNLSRRSKMKAFLFLKHLLSQVYRFPLNSILMSSQ